jgi:DhnA family fructose-bisphosphate aldolase class Ia
LDASGVTLNVFFGTDEKEQPTFLSECVFEGQRWGIPVIVFINTPENDAWDPGMLAYACRIEAEIGADVVKTNYTRELGSFVVCGHTIIGPCSS